MHVTVSSLVFPALHVYIQIRCFQIKHRSCSCSWRSLNSNGYSAQFPFPKMS